MGDTGVTIAARYDVRSQLALSSLIHALDETESYAVARYVVKDMKEPLLVLLAPDVEGKCLYDVPLPFAEDIRSYQFPPLDRVVTVSGSTVTKHRFLPGDNLSKAMSDYVDAMDVSSYAVDDDGYVVKIPEYNAAC
jgi:ATP-dependent DNA helicase 2 subunit 2